MRHNSRYMVVVLILTGIIAGLQLSSCGRASEAHHKIEPAHVEHIEGSELSRVTFTENAMERIGVETAKVTQEGGQKVVPYSSIVYDPHGHTWVYTSPQPRTFVRHEIKVDRIKAEKCFLKEGPPAGTIVASVGVAEIYGTEYEVGH